MQQGIICKVCPHGHLTDNKEAKMYYNCGIDAYNAQHFKKAIYLGFQSLNADYCAFQKMSKIREDILILDRHYTSQYVTAMHFGVAIDSRFFQPQQYYEFLIETSYNELCRRSILRGNNHSKLTDYILSSPTIYQEFTELYRSNILEHGNPKEYIINNERFQAEAAIIPQIDQLLYMR